MGGLELVPVGDVDLEVEVLGEGDAVVIVQTALTADELRPLAQHTAAAGFRVVHYHRRGYAGSGSSFRAGSMAAEAADCRALMIALDLVPAHVVGVSFSAAIALDLATSAPATVRTLTVVEPPPVGVPGAEEFVAVNEHLLEVFGADGAAVALDEFLTMLAGHDWRRESERALPGSVEAMERDATTFFESDVPALISWDFGAREAAEIGCPVLYVSGSDSGPWFAEMRKRMLDLLPTAEDAIAEGAGHLVASTHAWWLSRLLVDFLRRQPS